MSRPRPSAALVVASLALLVAVAQPGYAAIQESSERTRSAPSEGRRGEDR